MISIRRTHLIYGMLALSLLMNAAMLGYLAKSGGLRRIFLKMDLTELPKDRLDFQKEMESRYRKFPNTPAEVVFVGDSLVAGGPWSEYYSEIHNRGIGGDTAKALIDRIDEVTESHPHKIFLLVGTNDLAANVPVAQYIRHYRSLLERIRKESPESIINVIGVMPVNMMLPVKPTFDNEQVIEANKQLKDLVASFPGVRFINLGKYLVDETGNLRREFTPDGIHLNYDAYLAIREPLAALVVDGDSTKVSEAAAKP